ncbi:MAG: aminotransferase class I/II-fold pyridoxal phosphate-dependent enzyme [Acidimicrobiia bacterium]|nr:aminotransferase class I/II-fold pyridoxal phosphate-dependent enzyme [Acidimicrobiia bacterium]
MQDGQTTSGLDLLVLATAVGEGGGGEGGRGRRAGIESGIREAIVDGRLPAGARLPSTRALARDLGVARSTVVDAYAQLVAEGWVAAARGSGTRVASGGAHVAVRAARAQALTPPRHDFRPGRPDVSSFPRSAWLAAARRALRHAPDEALSYGDPRGDPGLREELAGYLGRARGVRAHPDLVVVCGGFTQGLSLVGHVLRQQGVTALGTEAPGVVHHRAVAAEAGLEVRPVPVDDDGAQVERLDELGVGAVLLTPAHQQPIGSSLSAARRGWVLDWARRTGSVVIEDDYDSEYRFDRAPLGALQGRAPDVVVYAGTVSKTLAPGLRLGWLVLPPDLLDAVVRAKARRDAQQGALDQLALAELIRSGAFDRHVRRMRLRYRARRDVLVAALAEGAPQVRVTGLAAGLHAVVELPAHGPAPSEMAAAAAARGIAVHPLSRFWYGPGACPPALVVGYGTPPEHAYRRAVAALVALLGGT